MTNHSLEKRKSHHKIIVVGPHEDDVEIAAGGTISIPGEVQGSVRLAGSQITVTGGTLNLSGANTYIGNGPNFMVKIIADQQRIHTPGFAGFIFKYTLPCMGPMLLLIWLLFFRQ